MRYAVSCRAGSGKRMPLPCIVPWKILIGHGTHAKA